MTIEVAVAETPKQEARYRCSIVDALNPPPVARGPIVRGPGAGSGACGVRCAGGACGAFALPSPASAVPGAFAQARPSASARGGNVRLAEERSVVYLAPPASTRSRL